MKKMVTKIQFGCMTLLLAAFGAATAFADASVLTYSGYNIGTETYPRKVFESLDLTKYELRMAANGVNYVGDTTHLNGAGRAVYLPISQTHTVVEGKQRIVAKVQSYFKYSTNPYQTLQMNIILEQRDDGVYAYCRNMFQSGNYEWNYPFEWMYYRDLQTEFGTPGSGRRAIYGDVGYDYRDIDGTFKKGFGIDFLSIGLVNMPETEVTTFTGTLNVEGNQVIEDPEYQVFSANLTGDGDMTYRATTPVSMPADVVSVGADVYLKKTWMTVATNRRLSDLYNVEATTCGTRTGVATPAAYGHWRNNGNFAAVQVYRTVSQYWQTGSVLVFRQCGTDIQAAITPYSYNKPWENGFDEATYQYGDIDFEKCAATITDKNIFLELSVATADATGQSGLKDLKLYFDENQPHYVEVTGKNQMGTGTTVRVVGTASARMWVNLNRQSDEKGLNDNGTLDVGQGGIVSVSHAVASRNVYVHDGGWLVQATNWFFSLSKPYNIRINNGTLALGGSPIDTSIKEKDTLAYAALHMLRLENGAKVIGHQPRIGYSGLYPYWHVTGTSPSSAECGFSHTSATTIVIDVDDVTDSSAVDFTISGEISEGDNGTGSIVKIGAGTLSLAAKNNLTDEGSDSRIIVSNGVWRLAANDAASSNLGFRLCGGGLAVAEEIDVTVGTVTLANAATITVESGATLAISTLADLTAADAKLRFSGTGAEAEKAIRIGTSACLTEAQLAKIRINSWRVSQDEDGYLVANQRGLLIIFK